MKTGLTWFLLVALSSCCSAQVVKFPASMCDFAFDEHSDQVLTISHQADSVYRFELGENVQKELVAAKQVKLESPYRIALKRFGAKKVCVAISGRNYDTLTVLDASTLETIKEFSFAGKLSLVRVMASLNSNDPFVYYTAVDRTESSVGRLKQPKTFAIDLRSNSDLGVVFPREIRFVSESGKTTACFECNGIDFGGSKPVLVKGENREFPFDPFRFYVDEKGQTRTDPLKISRSSDASYGYFHDLAVVVQVPGRSGKRPSAIKLLNINRNRQLDSMKLPEPVRGDLKTTQDNNGVYRRDDYDCFADDESERIIYCVANSMVVWNLDDFDFKREKLQPNYSFVVSKQRLLIGQKSEISVSQISEGLELKFENLPACFTKTSDGFVAVPTASDVGVLNVPFKLSGGDYTFDGKLEFEVVSSGKSAPFVVSDFVYDPQENAVFCWSGSDWTVRGTLHERDVNSSLSKVNLETGDSLPAQGLNFPIKQAELAGDRLVLMSFSGDRLQVHDASNLQKLAAQDFSDPDRATRFEIVDENIFVHGYNKELTILSLDGLNPVEQRKKPVGQDGNFFGIYMDGHLVRDQRTQQRRMLVSEISVPSAFNREGVYSAELTGKQVLIDSKRSKDEPIKGSLPQLVRKYNRETRKTQLVVEFPRDGKLLGSIPICSVDDGAHLPSVRLYDDLLIAGDGNNIVVQKVSEFIPNGNTYKARGDEFSFYPEQSHFLIDQPQTELKHKMIGGTAPIRFFERSFAPGINVDPETGNVTIDREAILKTLKQERAQQIPLDWKKLSKEFGTKLDQDFIQASVQISAIDGERKVAEIEYLVLVSPNENRLSEIEIRDRGRAQMVQKQIDALKQQTRGLEKNAETKQLIERLEKLKSKFERWKTRGGKKYFTEEQGK